MVKTISRALSVLTVVLMGVPLLPIVLHAQEEGAIPGMVKHRNDCRLAAQVLITDEPHVKRDWARDYISSCAEEGPPAIVREWQTVRADTVALVQLMRASTRIRDLRIYNQVRAVAADRSRPELVRVGAMYVLDNYVEPGHAGWFSAVPPANGDVSRVLPVAGWRVHTPSHDGPIPVTGSLRLPVLQLLQQIAASRGVEPVGVWYTAAALALRLQRESESVK